MTMTDYTRVLTDWNTSRDYAQRIIDYHTQESYTYDDFTEDWENISTVPDEHLIQLIYSMAQVAVDDQTDESVEEQRQSLSNSVSLTTWLQTTPTFTIPEGVYQIILECAEDSVDSPTPVRDTITRWVQHEGFEFIDEAPLAGWTEAHKLASIAIDTYTETEHPYQHLQEVWPSGVELPPEYALDYYLSAEAVNDTNIRNRLGKMIQTYQDGYLPDEVEGQILLISQPADIDIDEDMWKKAVSVADDIARQYYDGGSLFDSSEYDIELPDRIVISKKTNEISANKREEWVKQMATAVVDWIQGNAPKTYGSPYNPQRQSQSD